MAETKTEFVKRKKSEKRLQAERQVREAYAQTEELFEKDDSDEMVPVRGVVRNGIFEPWPIRMEPEIEDIYSTIDISKALGIKRERMREWMIRGYVKPSLPSTGKGTIAIFTRNDVLCVALLQKLIGMGFKRDVASVHIRQLLDSRLINVLSFIVLVYTEREGKPVVDFQLIADETLDINFDQDGNAKIGPLTNVDSPNWNGVHVINFLKLENEVDAALAELE